MATQDRPDNPKKPEPRRAGPSNLEKRPEDWVTGDEKMTDAQRKYLKKLSDETGEPYDPDLTKAQASRRIDELRGKPRL